MFVSRQKHHRNDLERHRHDPTAIYPANLHKKDHFKSKFLNRTMKRYYCSISSARIESDQTLSHPLAKVKDILRP